MSIQTWPVLEHIDKGTEAARETGGLDVRDRVSLALRLFHPLLSTVDAAPAGLTKFIWNQHHLVLNPIIQFWQNTQLRGVLPQCSVYPNFYQGLYCVIPCSFLIWPSRVCHVLAGKSLHMWHWYIRPARCLASTWLLRLLVTFAVKAQVVQTWRRPPTSSNVTDIWRFTRSRISAQKPMSERNFSHFLPY